MSSRILRCVKVTNKAFAPSFFFNSEKPQRKRINYCNNYTLKMQWVIHKCLTSSADLKRVETKQSSWYLRFLILRLSYTTSTLSTVKQLTRNSAWRSYDVCVNQFAEKDRKNFWMATGSCTTQCARTHFTFCAVGFGQTQHPPYSPDLAPCHFFLLSSLKKVLKRHQFEATENIKRNSTKYY
jgi:hypothetical protein